MASLPNPDTPMAFLPKDVAHEVTVACYVVVGCLAVSLWDFMDNIPCDILLVTRYAIRLPTLSYLFSRFITIVYFFFAAAFMSGSFIVTLPLVLAKIARTAYPFGLKCAAIGTAASALFAASVGSTTFILLLRVRAMYNRNLAVTSVFATLWLAVVASASMLPWALPSGKLGPTDYCIQLQPAPYLMATIITAFVNDTFVFIAITHRLMKMSTDVEEEQQNGVLSHLRMLTSPGKSLPLFSRVLLRDNQIYYSASITLRTLYFIVYFIPSIPTAYRMMFGLPCLLIFHVLVCRIFRKTKLGSLRHAGYCDVLITRAPTFGVAIAGVGETSKTTRQMGWPLEFIPGDSPTSTDEEQNVASGQSGGCVQQGVVQTPEVREKVQDTP